ncbi:MAG: 4-(cytidine 5'-diphospho)-2-C-methyl-D-erythritol kinase [Acidimicrobiales bacterium]
MTQLLAPAKLTWTLEVLARRADGLHELRADMTTISLCDVLDVDESADYLRVVGPHSAAVSLGPANLVSRALAQVGRRAGVTLRKEIPVGGGLGGGSADAAAILRWAGALNPATALELGSDVAFCVVGGHALVGGVGEVVSPLPFSPTELTLVMPDFAVSTGAVYRAYDEMIAARWRPSGTNHLEEPAARVEPRVARALAWLRERHGAASLAGSGSTMFVPRIWGDDDAWDDIGPDGVLSFRRVATTPG